jgi:hypothetical protein
VHAGRRERRERRGDDVSTEYVDEQVSALESRVSVSLEVMRREFAEFRNRMATEVGARAQLASRVCQLEAELVRPTRTPAEVLHLLRVLSARAVTLDFPPSGPPCVRVHQAVSPSCETTREYRAGTLHEALEAAIMATDGKEVAS